MQSLNDMPSPAIHCIPSPAMWPEPFGVNPASHPFGAYAVFVGHRIAPEHRHEETVHCRGAGIRGRVVYATWG